MARYIKLLMHQYKHWATYILSFIRRRKLTNLDFTIISNNCWAGFIYQRYNLPYQTPFLGLFIPAPSYIELLENFEQNMSRPLRFIPKEQSFYYTRIIKDGTIYPIALLEGTNIEIHFLHYKSPTEATVKWNERKARINLQNMLVKFAEIDCCTPDLVKLFDKLPFKNKICFAVNNYPNLKCIVPFPHKDGQKETTKDYKFIPPYLLERLNNCKEN